MADTYSPDNPFAPSATPPAGNPFAQPKQPAAPEPPGAIQSFFAGVNYDGIAQALGLPVDAVAGVLNLAARGVRSIPGGPDFGQIENPIGGAESIRDLMAAAGVPNPAPTTPGERLSRRIGQEVGAAAATGGVPFANVTQKAGSVGRALAEPAREAIANSRLGRYLGIEGAAATGAGIGGGVAQNQAPGSPVAETVGQIAGAIAPGAVSGAVRSGSALLQTPMPNQVEARAAAELQSVVTDKGAALDRMSQTIPGAKSIGVPLSTAQSSADPGLSALDRGMSRGPNQTRWSILKNEQSAALSEALDATEPKGATLPAVVDPNAPASSAGADPGPAVRSAQVRGAVDKEYEAFRTQARKLYDAVDPDDGVYVRLGPLRDAAQKAANEQGTLGGSAQFPEATVRDVLESGEAVSFNQLRRFRERLNAEIRTATSSQEGGKAAILGNLKSAIDDVLSDVMNGGPSLYGTRQGVDPAEAVARLRAANSFYRENAPRFKEGTTAKVLGIKGQGVTPEQTGAAYLRPDAAGGATAARDLLAALKGERRVGQQYLSSDLAAAAFDAKGGFNATGMRNWLNARPVAVAAFFGDPKNMMDLITSPGARGNMKRLIAIGEKDPELMQRIRKGFWDTMKANVKTTAQDQSGNEIITKAGLINFIKENADLLPVVYRDNPEQLGRIYQIRDTMQDIARPEGLSRVGTGSDTELNRGAKKIGTSRVAERFLDVAAQTAGIDPTSRSVGRLVAMVGGAAKDFLTRRDAVDRMLVDAMIDPELAKALLTRTEGRKSVLAKEYLGTYFRQAAGQQGRVEAVDQGEGLQP